MDIHGNAYIFIQLIYVQYACVYVTAGTRLSKFRSISLCKGLSICISCCVVCLFFNLVGGGVFSPRSASSCDSVPLDCHAQ